MVRKKWIEIFSIILIAISAITVLLLWKYSFAYRHEYEVYDSRKITFTSDDSDFENYICRTHITENNGKINFNGSGAYLDKNTIYITAGGVYELSGNFVNIIIKASDRMPVILRLNNAYIESRAEPPIYVYKTSKLVISSEEKSENYIVDSRGKYSVSDIKSAVYSKSDITFNGSGKTVIQSKSKDAVITKGILKIISGIWDISSDTHGISGNLIFIQNGQLNCSAGKDAVRSDVKKNKGLIILKGGDVKLHSGGDAVFSSGNIYLDGTNVNAETGSTAAVSAKNSAETEIPSMKGFKADKSIYINNGDIVMNTEDDAFHAADEIRAGGGKLTIAAGDDAIHCDKNVYFDNIYLNITKCYEGIEGAYIEINNGEFNIIADDDGINGADGTSHSLSPPDKPGEKNEAVPNMPPGEKQRELPMMFVMNNGNVYIEAGGDGIDINGSAEVNGGNIETYCMTDGPDEAFDTDGSLYVNGGNVFGAGNPNMFEPPDETSKLNSLICYTDGENRDGGTVIIKNSAGEIIENHNLKGAVGIIIAYGEKIKSGETYTVSFNGREMGSAEINGTNTIIKSEAAEKGREAPGGPPPMDENGKPLEPPPDKPGGKPGKRPDETMNNKMSTNGNTLQGDISGADANEKPPEPPPGENEKEIQINADTADTENNMASKEILTIFLIGLAMMLAGYAAVKFVRRKF